MGPDAGGWFHYRQITGSKFIASARGGSAHVDPAFDLGLTSLPPTVAEMEQFVGDETGAYERLVDRLLAKPAFGERWGRHWLDVVRFGESSELTVNDDKPRSNAWRFRDAVIRRSMRTVPFDQFVRFHFVPDENKELGQFIHLGTRLQDNANPNDKQFHRLDDMVATTGVAFLGSASAARGAMIIRWIRCRPRNIISSPRCFGIR